MRLIVGVVTANLLEDTEMGLQDYRPEFNDRQAYIGFFQPLVKR